MPETAPRPDVPDEPTDEIAAMLWHIQDNYHREGSDPGSRFEGRTLESVQAEAVIRTVRAQVMSELFGTPQPDTAGGLPVDAVRLCETARPGEHRRRTLVDLDAGRIAADELDAAGLQGGHIVDLREDGWTIQHPLTCGVDLFACPVNRAAERDLTGPPHEFGRFECGVEDGEFWIGEAR